MPYSTGIIRAVNPVSLAHASSITKIPRFASPIAPVIRPNLLTSQLMGGCPSCAAGGPVGLTGFIPPDYGSLRNGGSYGLFKMASSGHGLGKGASGAHAADYMTRSWAFGLRGLGKGASGAHAADYMTRSWSFGLRGLGQDFTSSGDPGVDTLSSSYTNILNNFPSGAGASSSPLSEANQIVPTQNALVAYLGTITNQILTGKTPSVATLQQLYVNVWTAFANFIKFVLSPKFVVRMASGQALNTVMPYCDGSCGYAVPLGQAANPTQQNCLSWGNGTIGGAGTNGMLGAIARAIANMGGTLPTVTTPQQAANMSAASSAAAPVYSPTGAPTAAASVSSFLSGSTGGIPNALLVFGVIALLAMKR